ncbi:hypothetical protein GGC47_004518 [Bosea sp. OAE752]
MTDIPSKGSKARATKLSPERRKAIAEKAASMRWAKPPIAMTEIVADPVDGEVLPRCCAWSGSGPGRRASHSRIGIDDFAWRRNHRYGTIVCDLERRLPVVLLPDREPATSEAWLLRQSLIQGCPFGRLATAGLPAK